jgi:murein DD-endopeptidase MepM/ murein hydrolase activator NlpD
MKNRRVMDPQRYGSPRARLTATWQAWADSLKSAVARRPAWTVVRAIHVPVGARLAVVGLVILSVRSSEAQLGRAQPALSLPMPALHSTHQAPSPDYPRGGHLPLIYDETQVVRQALPLTSRISPQPESRLPANSDLQSDADLSSAGTDRNSPWVDAVMYTAQQDDLLDGMIKQGNRRGLAAGAARQAAPDAARATGTGGGMDAGQCAGVTTTPVGTGKFIWPTDVRQVSGNPYAPWHRGVDLSGSPGDPVYAADTGVVTWAGSHSWGYGLMVMLDHGNGWQTLYAHLSQVHVRCGQTVPQGTVIGAVGSTGHSTGPHLHFEMRLDGEPTDPCQAQVGFEQACLPVTFNVGPSAPIGSWLGRYYDNEFLEGDPSLARTDLAIDFDWGHSSPGSGIPKTMWSARWTRTIDLAAGTYRFRAVVDDGIRVFVDDQAVIDQWHDAASVEYAGDKALAAGKHTLQVEYYQKGHEAKVKFWWERLR